MTIGSQNPGEAKDKTAGEVKDIEVEAPGTKTRWRKLQAEQAKQAP